MLAYLANLSTMQIILGLAGGFVGILILRTIFTRGGPRHRMKQNKLIWVVVPVLVAVGGGLAWFVIKVMGPSGGIHI